MARRIAAALSLIVFGMCLFAGLAAGNPPATILEHALEGLIVTLIVGLAVGAMAEKMLDENIKSQQAAAAIRNASPAVSPEKIEKKRK